MSSVSSRPRTASCKEGKATEKIEYLTADQEEGKVIAQANSELDGQSHLVGKITVRRDGEFLEVDPKQVRLHGRLAQADHLRRRRHDSLPRA